jgi:fused signal recognition particle receptor
MLGWFKKKFRKKEETDVPVADLKIPVAPRDFGAGTQHTEETPVTPDETALSELQGSTEPLAEPVSDFGDKETEAVEVASTPDEPGDPVVEELQPEEIESAPPAPADTLSDEEPEVTNEATTEAIEEIEEVTQISPQTVAEEVTVSEVIAELKPEPPEKLGETEESIESAPRDIASEEISQQTEVLEESKPEATTTAADKIPVAPRRESVTPEPTKAPKASKPLLSRLSEKLSRTRETFTYQLDTLFLGRKEIDNNLLDDLEELLITADLGVATTQEILDHARKKVKRKELSDPDALKGVLKAKLKSFITDHHQDAALVMPKEGPFVIMVIGVNGVGKTTTIGKIAHKFVQSGQSVLLVAADTFRAAAVSQLKIWGERNNVSVLSQKEGTDPSSVVFDAIAHAKAKQYDVVLVDTAGRLHTQANLMEELKKIKRVMAKQLPGAPHEVMLVVDATTGQNGISQAKLFDAAVDITGIALTKLDGTAKGGIVANISKELKTPIRFIGIGEKLEDLRDFDPDEFIDALFQDTRTAKK